ncbi:Smr/MutS family protein [Candidatus Binatia bacterium]|jgi:DNA-nicking Smr family endonuclease|nr:Smr/MutS family protein [Candidatus Binatia bacterium]
MESHQGRSGPGQPEEPGEAGREQGLDDEWAMAIQDVVPLKDRGAVESDDEEASPQGALADRLKSRREPTVPLESDGALPAIDRRTAERLRRGQIAIEAQIDLHGLTQDEAFTAIQDFLAESLQAGRRCVLVITGKGTARDGGGVLRSSVPRWLTEGIYRQHLIGIAVAFPQHGGDGALYVLLRRLRDQGV